MHGSRIDRLSSAPLDVWNELLGISWKFAFGRKYKDSCGSPLANQLTTFIDPFLRHNLNVAIRERADLKSILDFGRLIVARLVQAGNQSFAVDLTKDILYSVPQDITPRHKAGLLTIVHQLLAFAPIGSSSHWQLRVMLAEFLRIRPTMHYDALTLMILLRSLSRTKNASWQAFKLLLQWIETWGPDVEDAQVQLRIATMAMREGREDIAFVMIDRATTRLRRDNQIKSRTGPTQRNSWRRVLEMYPRCSRRFSRSTEPRLITSEQSKHPMSLPRHAKSIRRLQRALIRSGANTTNQTISS
jgi:hypothetical protein